MFDFTRRLLRKGDKARDLRDWPAAQHAYGRALQRNPALAPIWVQYGHALKENGSLEAAFDAYCKADQLSPGQADTQRQVAVALDLLNDPERAHRYFGQGPGLAEFLVRQGDRSRNAGDWPAARAAYAEALQQNPELAPIWVQYGHTLKELRLLKDALAAYQRADTLVPDQADTHLQIGRALDMLGEPRQALEHFERSIALARQPSDADRERLAVRGRLHRPRPAGMPGRLRFLNLGTTGTCNASCVHCPTGKAETAHAPRGTMPMALYKKIIDGIADYQLTVTDQIAFGLFGDALVDPLVVERAQYLRAELPDVRLSINTNGAAFNRAKHAPLKDLAHIVALHCESIDPATYNYLMQPLRLERVMPKMEQILDTFAGQVVVSVPISTRNRDQALEIKQWFLDRGAIHVEFDALSSRCAEDRTLFDSLALNPKPIACPPIIMDDLIVDCDGQVLICCQDFKRIEGIGSMQTESFADVLVGAQRHKIRQLLAENRHQELATCSRCFADLRGEFVPA